MVGKRGLKPEIQALPLTSSVMLRKSLTQDAFFATDLSSGYSAGTGLVVGCCQGLKNKYELILSQHLFLQSLPQCLASGEQLNIRQRIGVNAVREQGKQRLNTSETRLVLL